MTLYFQFLALKQSENFESKQYETLCLY